MQLKVGDRFVNTTTGVEYEVEYITKQGQYVGINEYGKGAVFSQDFIDTHAKLVAKTYIYLANIRMDYGTPVHFSRDADYTNFGHSFKVEYTVEKGTNRILSVREVRDETDA